MSTADELPGFPGAPVVPDEAVIDGQGRVAFTTSINDPFLRRNALFAERDGELKLIAGPDTLPGLADNESVLQIGHFSANASGQIAFEAEIAVPCVDPDCDFDDGLHSVGSGYWIAQENGDVSLLIRSGDFLEVAPGDLRQVYTLHSTDGPHLNDRGQFAFAAQFFDGSQGVFRAQLVPEPTTLKMVVTCLLGAACIVCRRSRTHGAR